MRFAASTSALDMIDALMSSVEGSVAADPTFVLANGRLVGLLIEGGTVLFVYFAYQVADLLVMILRGLVLHFADEFSLSDPPPPLLDVCR